MSLNLPLSIGNTLIPFAAIRKSTMYRFTGEELQAAKGPFARWDLLRRSVSDYVNR